MKRSKLFKKICLFLVAALLNEIIITDWARLRCAYANSIPSPAINLLQPSPPFQLPLLVALQTNPQNPLEIDFVIDTADQGAVSQQETRRLIQYFLALLTIPEDELWVNLSPYESDRIIPETLGKTEVGRQLLQQDYVLKQFSASMTYPQNPLGKEFWQRCYEKAKAVYGVTDIPINTFNKVWIVPESAVVYERDAVAFIGQSRLKVMLDEDYQAMRHDPQPIDKKQQRELNYISLEITREIILPEINKEINEGKQFATLRQIYHALILATWFKRKLKENILNKIYTDQHKTAGIATDDPQIKEKIYRQYIETFKRGVYNYIQEDYDPASGEIIPRKYFSGGFTAGDPSQWLSIRPLAKINFNIQSLLTKLKQRLVLAKIRLSPLTSGPGRFGYFKAMPLRNLILGLALFGITSPFFAPAALGHPPVAQPNPVSITRIGTAITPGQESQLDLVKNVVTLNDVLALDGQVNPLTGKTYKIDKTYFKRNWDKIFQSHLYGWPQETAVIAAQKLLNVQQDGDLGSITREAMESRVEQNKKPLPEPPAMEPGPPEAPSGKTASPEVPVAKIPATTDESLEPLPDKIKNVFTGPLLKWVNHFKTSYKQYHNIIFGILSATVIGFVLSQIAGHYKRIAYESDPFLDVLTDYLKGGASEHPFTHSPEEPLIARKARFQKIIARRVGNRIELTLRANNALHPDDKRKAKKIRKLIRQAFEAGEITVALKGNTSVGLNFKSTQVNTTNLKLRLQIPKDNGLTENESLVIDYKTSAEQRSSFEIPLTNDTFQDFTNAWQATLESDHIFETKLQLQQAIETATLQDELAVEAVEHLETSKTFVPAWDMKQAKTRREETSRRVRQLNELWSLEEIVDQVSRLRAKNPFNFKDLRGQPAVMNFRLRRLAKHTLKKIVHAHNVNSVYRDYFYYLVRYQNTTRRIYGHSGTLDTSKDQFLPFRDDFWIKIGGLTLHKFLSIFFLQEFNYNRIKGKILDVIPVLCLEQKQVILLERDILGPAATPQKILTVEQLEKEFYEFNASFERPYANSIVGPDLWRRQRNFIKLGKTLLVMASAVLISWQLEWELSSKLWVILLSIANYGIFSFILPNIIINLTERKHLDYARAIENIYPMAGPPPEHDLSVSEKENFLRYFSARYLPELPRPFSRFVLRARRFFDIKAIRLNANITIQIVADSNLKHKDEKKIAEFVRNDWTGSPTEAPSGVKLSYTVKNKNHPVGWDRVAFEGHPTGLRMTIKDIPAQAQAITLSYGLTGKPGEQKSLWIPIESDPFQSLVSEWQHYLEDPDRLDAERINKLIRYIHAFQEPEKLRLADFKKNAGYYHTVRNYAFETYSLLTGAQIPEVTPYADYFLELAEHAADIRSLTASFSGMDVRKGEHLPDKHKLLWKPFGISMASILRAIYGGTFLYSWAITNTLEAINRAAASLQRLETKENALLNRPYLPAERYERIRKKLINELETIDLSFRYPAQHSIVPGKDLYGRSLAMWTKLFYLGLFMFSIGLVMMPVLNFVLRLAGWPVLQETAAVEFLKTPQILGVSLATGSILYFIMLFWISPYHAHIESTYEKSFYQDIINQYRNNPKINKQDLLALDERRQSFFQKRRKFFNLSVLISGAFFPAVIPLVFLSQQITFMLKKTSPSQENASAELHPAGSISTDKNVSSPIENPSENSEDRSYTSSSPVASSPSGGIDLKLAPQQLLILPDNTGNQMPLRIPAIDPGNLKGFHFDIIQFVPIMDAGYFFIGSMENKETSHVF